MLKVLIVDDEPLARERIRSFLEHEKDIEICAECADGLEAAKAIVRFSPGLIFLDIQMPELDGFGLIQTIGIENMPFIIFVTAFDEYAIQAFEAQALDYLLKPFDRERFQKALDRARTFIQKDRVEDLNDRIKKMLFSTAPQEEYLKRIVVKNPGKIYFVPVEEILWIEAAGNYLDVHTGEKTHCIRETMRNMESQLDPQSFLRIHRSTIVNVNQIKEMKPYLQNDFVVILSNGDQLVMSRTYRMNMEKLLRKNL